MHDNLQGKTSQGHGSYVYESKGKKPDLSDKGTKSGPNTAQARSAYKQRVLFVVDGVHGLDFLLKFRT